MMEETSLLGDYVLAGVFATLSFVTIVYMISLAIKDVSIIDIAWGLGFVMLVWLMIYIEPDVDVMQIVVSVPIVAWGLRLATHIGTRKIGKPEDWRYAAWRKAWGHTFLWRSYLQIFLLQGFLMLVIALPLFVATADESVAVLAAPNILIGLAVWSVGFFFEAVGDLQLRLFLRKQETKGHIMRSGLWKYTRHPNYFGEMTMWWGLWLVVVLLPYGWLAIVSPLTITFLLTKVSGVAMLEKKYVKHKEFKAYKKVTNAILPAPPKA